MKINRDIISFIGKVLTGTLVKYWNGLDTPTMRTFHVVVGVATALGVLFSLVSGCQSNYFASKVLAELVF